MTIAAIHSTAYGRLMLAGIFTSILFLARLARLGQPRPGRHLCRNQRPRFQAPSGAAYSADDEFSKRAAHHFQNMSPRRGLGLFCSNFYNDAAPDGALTGRSI
jgi:hypothetical protein